ncbi:MAG: hypothetical protein QOH68_3657, partial [Nocardioidaceae bacterium]|nr:hypothetical protein [Nocardioidaceae bacterium]
LVAMFVRHYGTCTTTKSDVPKKEPRRVRKS